MRRIPLIILLFLLLGFGGGFGVAYAVRNSPAKFSKNEELSRLNSRIEKLKKEITQKEKLISSLNSDKSRLNYQLSETQVKNTKLKLQIEERNKTISRLIDELAKVEKEKARLEKKLTPSPDHALTQAQVFGNPEFQSKAWEGKEREWQSKVEEIWQRFHASHTYIADQYDCNDMAIELWNMLLTAEIKSVIVVGNLDMVGETLNQSEHAWLYVFNPQGRYVVLDPLEGLIWSTNPKFGPYKEGFIYKQPSDLRADLKMKW